MLDFQTTLAMKARRCGVSPDKLAADWIWQVDGDADLREEIGDALKGVCDFPTEFMTWVADLGKAQSEPAEPDPEPEVPVMNGHHALELIEEVPEEAAVEPQCSIELPSKKRLFAQLFIEKSWYLRMCIVRGLVRWHKLGNRDIAKEWHEHRLRMNGESSYEGVVVTISILTKIDTLPEAVLAHPQFRNIGMDAAVKIARTCCPKEGALCDKHITLIIAHLDSVAAGTKTRNVTALLAELEELAEALT